MKYFVTGGAGFVGSHLVDRLVRQGGQVTVYDNLSSGKKDFLKQHLGSKNFRFVKADVLDLEVLKKEIKGHDFVFHLAANPDIAKGLRQTDLDLKQGTLATYNVLEAMRVNGIKDIAYASSSAIYGETNNIAPEDYGPILPISLYAAAKVGSEALISAFCHTFDMRTWIFRPANIIGGRLTHGIIFDFIRKLKNNPNELEILGDGKQTKSYIYIDDFLDAVMNCIEKSKEKINLFNIGSDDFIDAKTIAEIVANKMDLKPNFRFTGGSRGWRGDVPITKMDLSKIRKLGIRAGLSSRQAVEKAASEMLKEAI